MVCLMGSLECCSSTGTPQVKLFASPKLGVLSKRGRSELQRVSKLPAWALVTDAITGTVCSGHGALQIFEPMFEVDLGPPCMEQTEWLGLGVRIPVRWN